MTRFKIVDSKLLDRNSFNFIFQSSIIPDESGFTLRFNNRKY